ncbi:hypothetical protein GPNADHDJ_02629 [Stenotrophomonas maltophilia]|uniref:Uncharacterized protein n=2 Tax=Stenotrophomonas maltophilia group TaxID=995085 RepID=A0AAX1IDG9_STEMA|nr:hypothetical protein GPNADHDJ_02576 [Stenotrophomonas maltophilia]QNG78413.1 hypothetical protein GPNADHDJ_02629 [Stenotrophomonas maltophilia]GMR26688.1 hypothetical protein STENOSP10_09070 [Stenotrophomonas sepilia]
MLGFCRSRDLAEEQPSVGSALQYPFTNQGCR